MKVFATLAGMMGLIAAGPLDVRLDVVGNSQVEATIMNNGKRELKVLMVGSILDPAPVEKVKFRVAVCENKLPSSEQV